VYDDNLDEACKIDSPSLREASTRVSEILQGYINVPSKPFFYLSRSGLVVKFVLAMHEPRVRFTAATMFCLSNL
jgi:hypothetical protein